MPALSVLGTSSWAGKSLVATALCRWFAREGVRVAPFKAQNMSNNARVAAGGEIGAAQYLQALACGLEPEVRMNPVLVKPEDDRRSQVVVSGRVDEELSRRDWRERSPAVRDAVEAALSSLMDGFELVVIEGAGSPAETNLTEHDLSNLHATELAGANALLVADISRGGAFAHLFGTWSLAPAAVRDRVGGFVLNRFRGDPELLEPGPRDLQRLTGVATLGVLPELDHRLPDEDGVARRPLTGSGPRVAVVLYPTASNLDEFRVLEEVAEVVWARRPADLAAASLVILPGSKEPLRDLRWLRSTGLAEAIGAVARENGRVLGICGGLQLLGRDVECEPGLGLLPLATSFADDKIVRRREIAFGALEAPAVVEALVGRRPRLRLEETFDELADAVEAHLDTARVRALATLGPTQTPPKRERAVPAASAPRSLVLVNTGHGKGKSTAAFGVLLRAVARRGWRTCVVQFVKSGRWKVGEEQTARRLGVDWVKGGDGFSWESRDLATSEALAVDAWRLARELIAGGEHQLVVLDEITYPINWGWIDGAEVAEAIRARPERVNVIATGRDAPPGLIAVADTVTEMVKVRHAYDAGIRARRGLDF